MNESTYQSPFSTRYASEEMSYLFSPYFKYTTWRELWVALAKAQKELGLAITAEQIESMQAAIEKLDLSAVEEYEKKLRHDVMAHIHAFGDQCPSARGIIHLGATSCYVTDNGDLIQMREALKLIRNKIVFVLRHLHAFATQWADLPTLSYTHFQAAQPTTVGKRACLWLQDFFIDLQESERMIEAHASFICRFVRWRPQQSQTIRRACRQTDEFYASIFRFWSDLYTQTGYSRSQCAVRVCRICP
jgi:adenylosuccinate lyase